MRFVSVLLCVAALFAATTPVAAQRSTPTSSANSAPRVIPPLPNSRIVGAGLNPASELVDKRRRLALDDSTLGALRTLEATFDARYAEDLARYDSLRAQVTMARNRVQGAMAPSAEEQQIARERTIVLTRVVAALRQQREKDVAEALAALPEEKRAMAQDILTEQSADLARAFRRSGPEGAALSGGPPGSGPGTGPGTGAGTGAGRRP